MLLRGRALGAGAVGGGGAPGVRALGAGYLSPEPSRLRSSGPERLGPDGSHWVLRVLRVRPEQAEVWRAAGRRGVLTAGAGPELPSRVDRWAWASAARGTGWPSSRGPDPWGCTGSFRGRKNVWNPLKLKLQMVWAGPCGCWELNSGPGGAGL